MENAGIQFPLWVQVISAIACFGVVILIATWEIFRDWAVAKAKALREKTLAVTRHSPHFSLKVGRHATRAGH